MIAGEFDLDPALARNAMLCFMRGRSSDLDRKDTGRVLIACREAWVFQPFENLIGVDIVTTRNPRP